MCRVPISALSQATTLERPLRNLEYVDLSSREAWWPLMKPVVAADRKNVISPLTYDLNHAAKKQEVLVAWRGSLPKNAFEVIDSQTGEYIRMLDNTVPLFAASHWQQTFAAPLNPACFNSLFYYTVVGVVVPAIILH